MKGIRYVSCIMFAVAMVLLPVYVYGYLYSHYALGSLVADGISLVVFGGLIYFTRHEPIFGHRWIVSRLKKWLAETREDRISAKWVLGSIVAAAAVTTSINCFWFLNGEVPIWNVVRIAIVGIVAFALLACLVVSDWAKEADRRVR